VQRLTAPLPYSGLVMRGAKYLTRTAVHTFAFSVAANTLCYFRQPDDLGVSDRALVADGGVSFRGGTRPLAPGTPPEFFCR
jgi:hypothetical protein